MKLEHLIEKIKQDGVAAAKEQSGEIVAQAKKEAAGIVAQAKKEAAAIIEQAKQDAENFKANAQDSLRQAARDLTLLLSQEMIKVCDGLMKRDVTAALSPDFISELFLKIVDKWSPASDEPLSVLVGKEDKAKLEKLVLSQLKEEAKKKIVIKVSPNISKGFLIGLEGDETYYDFSEESILEALKELINPALSAIIAKDNG